MTYKYVVCFVIGLITGIRLTDFWDYIKVQTSCTCNSTSSNIITNITKSNTFRSSESFLQIRQPDFNLTYDKTPPLAKFLFNHTRVLCWVMTKPEYHLKRSIHIKNTWGKRCNKLLFFSSQEDTFLETIKLAVKEGRSHLWEKTREAFKYIYDHHYNDADWFLKADDDTYLVMENLRLLLNQHSPDAPVYFGSKFHPFVKQGYMSGGAGYVLSKEALRRFIEISNANTTLCKPSLLSEDKEMGICLQNVGVAAGDSRDDVGLERFLPLGPMHLIPIDISEWYESYLFYARVQNISCCSSKAISFHYIKPKEFYLMDYFLYTLRPFGIHNAPDKLPAKLSTIKLVDKWRSDLSDNIFRDKLPKHFH